MPRDYLPLSPLLPDTPNWQELALECSRAYFALEHVRVGVTNQECDGHDFWQAKARADKAASAIAAWSSDPDLSGRLLARERILRELYGD